jgi:hypothetical protein
MVGSVMLDSEGYIKADTAPTVRFLHVQPTHGHISMQNRISVPRQGQP